MQVVWNGYFTTFAPDINCMVEEESLKLKTARTLKWNTIDRLSSQVLYAITGIVLANLLTPEEFGLVGAVLVFQAFAALFVDSGFSNALIQKKLPTEVDYCTVLYFNLAMSVAIYVLLWFCSPFIDDWFGAGGRLVAPARVMFLAFVINATAIVQTNRLTKRMDVKMIAVSNTAGLVVSGIVGIWLAVAGMGAWAIVWQTIVLAAVKSALLWATSHWWPRERFSMASLRSIFNVGAGIMATSFLNILFQNIYSFIIGAYYNLSKLGYYTQADKWSKMGVASLSQVVTASFLPILSGCQDDRERFHRMMSKTHKFTAYITISSMLLLAAVATPIFHLLFGTKWDEAVPLFQMLVVRGIFVVLTALYHNHIIALGAARRLVYSEVMKDALAIVAIVATIPLGVWWLVAGQVAASALHYAYAVWLTASTTGYSLRRMLAEPVPYVAISLVALVPVVLLPQVLSSLLVLLPVQLVVFAMIFIGTSSLLHSRIQQEVFSYIFKRKISK